MKNDDHCISCGDELNALDVDPNGEANPDCARCRAEQAHDFDKQPNVRFSRGGNMLPGKRGTAARTRAYTPS